MTRDSLILIDIRIVFFYFRIMDDGVSHAVLVVFFTDLGMC